MIPFAQRFAHLSVARSPLCLGLDPSDALITAWGLPADPSGLQTFCDRVLDAAGDLVAVIKPQAAFFERFGSDGMATLARVTARVRQQGSLSLIDAKRGDVAGTMAGYAAAMLGPGSGFGGDAVTLNAYLGFDALRPVFDRAVTTGSAAFVVVHPSNPEGRALQAARQEDGRTVAEALADGLAGFNAAAGHGVLGAVIGATLAPNATAIVTRVAGALILAPGVGAQGASMCDVGERFAGAAGRVLPSVSRAILEKGPSPGALRDEILRFRHAARATFPT